MGEMQCHIMGGGATFLLTWAFPFYLDLRNGQNVRTAKGRHMFVRAKKSGKYQCLRVVHNQSVHGEVRQRVIGTLGRVDILKMTGQLDGLIASCSRYARRVAVPEESGRPLCCELPPGNTRIIITYRKATYKIAL